MIFSLNIKFENIDINICFGFIQSNLFSFVLAVDIICTSS